MVFSFALSISDITMLKVFAILESPVGKFLVNLVLLILYLHMFGMESIKRYKRGDTVFNKREEFITNISSPGTRRISLSTLSDPIDLKFEIDMSD